MPSHLIGLLLGTEEDWPTAFESLVDRLGPIRWRGEKHELDVERLTMEPFDLRYRPRYPLVIDRLAWWYDLPRAWLKKVALMDDVYLLNNPFTFQSMEKHSAYCAMMRLGIKVPSTWLIPHKVPAPFAPFEYMAEKLPDVASKYNAPFELDEIGERVGYPLYMKPFDGGQWVGVSRVGSPEELRARYDESGQRMMHLQRAIEDYEVFARSLSIGPETMVMHFRPERAMHDRYEVDHGFLTPQVGWEVVTVSKLVNAFFRWEFNSCETIVKGDEAAPIDYANASPDVALTSLHYYFPWAIRSLVRWCAFCVVTGRRMRVDLDTREFFAVGDRLDLSYDAKLREYRRLADEYFETDRYEEFLADALGPLDEVTVEYFESAEFDQLLVDSVRSTFPEHEQEQFIEHYRGLLSSWTGDQRAAV
jgi:hypothetical protein